MHLLNPFVRSDPGVDSTSNRNEYLRCSVGGKGSRCVGLTILPPSCADCLKILNLSLLKASGPI